MSFLNFGKSKSHTLSNKSTASKKKLDENQDLGITDEDLQTIYSDIKVWALKNKDKYPDYIELYKHLPLEINSAKDLVCVAWALYNGAANPKDHEETRAPMKDPLVEWYLDGFSSSFEVLLNPDFISAATKYIKYIGIGVINAQNIDGLFIESFKSNGMAFEAQMDEREALYLQPASQTKAVAKAFAQELQDIYNDDARFKIECENIPHLAKVVVDIEPYRPGSSDPGATGIYINETLNTLYIMGKGYGLNSTTKDLQPLIKDDNFMKDIPLYGIFNPKALSRELEDSLFRHGNPSSSQDIKDLTNHLLENHDMQKAVIIGVGNAFIMRKINQSPEEFLKQTPIFIKKLNTLLVHAVYPGKGTQDMIDLATNDQAMEL